MANDKVVYFHINPLKNEVFYVGIGSKARAYSKDSRNRFWKFLVSKYGFIVNIVAENLSIEQAKQLEINLKYILFSDMENLNTITIKKKMHSIWNCKFTITSLCILSS